MVVDITGVEDENVHGNEDDNDAIGRF